MIASLVILAFILAMAIVWSQYGAFSAFLHLVVVIVAGALAFAFWEPLAQVLLGRMPRLAWGVALVGPFALWLIALRVVMDKLVRGNLHVADWVDKVGGAVLAAVAAGLTAGVTLIGLQYLGVSGALLNYTPYTFAADSTPEREDTLWLPADRWAATFYTVLSRGAFGTGTPLAVRRPALAAEAGQFALLKDPNASPIALRDEVKIERWTSADGLPDGLHPSAERAMRAAVGEDRLVFVTTAWEPGSAEHAFAFDGEDRNLRLHRHQVQLITGDDDGRGGGELHLPIGYVRPGVDGGADTYYPFSPDVDWAVLSAEAPVNTLGWVYAIAPGRRPTLLHARQQVIDLPPPTDVEPAALAQQLGQTADQPVREAWAAFVEALYNRDGGAVASAASASSVDKLKELQTLAEQGRDRQIETKADWEKRIIAGLRALAEQDPQIGKQPTLMVASLATRGLLPEPPRGPDGGPPEAESVSITRLGGVRSATVSLAGSNQTVKLVDEGGRWKVNLFSYEAGAADGVDAGPRQGITAGQTAERLAATADLPRPISASRVRTLPNSPGGRLQTREEGGRNVITGGAGIAQPASGQERTSRVEAIHGPSTKRMARLRIKGAEAKSLFGQAFATVGELATATGNAMLVTDRGVEIPPMAYVVLRADGSQEIVIAGGLGFGAGNPIPIRDLKRDETMYLYYQVNPGTTIEKYKVARSTFPFEQPLTVR